MISTDKNAVLNKNFENSTLSSTQFSLYENGFGITAWCIIEDNSVILLFGLKLHSI